MKGDRVKTPSFSFKNTYVWGNLIAMGFKDKMLNKKPLNNKAKMGRTYRFIKLIEVYIKIEIFVFVAILAVLLIVVMFGCSKANAASDPAIEAGLIPHKALYDIQLSSKKSGVMISNLSGKMMYEWHPSCDGWVSNYQFDMLYEYVEMPAARITSDVSTFEGFDGKSFNFNVQRKKDNYPFEQYRGAAVAEGNGVPSSVLYSVPKDLTQQLPKGTFFPMAHTLDVLKKIKQGKSLYSAPLFDGSSDDGPTNVNTFIGREYMYKKPETVSEGSATSNEGDIDPALVNTKAWDLRLAFFPLDSSDIMSDYEMSVVFHENGVISSMEIEYADFSILQTLLAVEPVETGCDIPVSQGEDEKKTKE